MDNTVGKAIRQIKKEGIKTSYFLLGDDAFLQNIFIKYLKNRDSSVSNIKYLDLSDNRDCEFFFNEIDNISLFNSKNIFAIRNSEKISNKNKEHLLKCIKNKNDDNILVFTIDDYILRNKFLKEVYNFSVKINTNTPFFPSKIKDWAKYYMNENDIVLDDSLLNYLINSYGDNIANVINEIEKIFLITNKSKIKFSDYESNYKNRNLKYWNLMNALGIKNIKETLKVFDSLQSNGTSIIPIITNLTTFYSALMYSINNEISNIFRLNNTIKSRLSSYNAKYTFEEISNIILALRNIDIIAKSSNLNDNLLFYPFALKICKGYYGR